MKGITLLILKHGNFWREDGKHPSLLSNQRSILYDINYRRTKIVFLKKIFFFSFISFVSRRIFNSTTYFSFWVVFGFHCWPSKHVEVFFKLLLYFTYLLQTKSKYISCGTRIFEIKDGTNNKIKHGKTFLSRCHTRYFNVQKTL